MPLETGERLIGRFEIRNKSSNNDGLLRFDALDHSTGEQVQIICPSSSARLRSGAIEHFEHCHQNQQPAPIWIGTKDKTPIVVYQQTLTPLETFPKVFMSQNIFP